MSDEQKPLSAEQIKEMTSGVKPDQVFVMQMEGNKYRIGLPNGGFGSIYEVSPEGIEALKKEGVTVRESTPLTPEQLAGRAKYEAALAAEEARANKPLNASEVNTVVQNLSGNPDIQHMEGDVYRIRGSQERGLGHNYHLSPEAVQTLHDKNINIQNDPAPAKAEVRGREPLYVEPLADVRGREPLNESPSPADVSPAYEDSDTSVGTPDPDELTADSGGSIVPPDAEELNADALKAERLTSIVLTSSAATRPQTTPPASSPVSEERAGSPVYLKANHLPNGEVEFTPVGATAAKPIVAAPPAPSQTEPQAAPDPAPAEPEAVSADDKPYGAYKGKTYEASVEPRSKVREAQSYLETMGKSTGTRNHAKLGHRPEDMDGIPGPSTDAAIRKFQEENNLPVNGKLDEQTMGALKTGAEAVKAQQSERTQKLGQDLGLVDPADRAAAAAADGKPQPSPLFPTDMASFQHETGHTTAGNTQQVSQPIDLLPPGVFNTGAAQTTQVAAQTQTPEQLRDAVNAEMANGIGKNESRVVEDFIAKNNPKATDRNSDLSIDEQAEFSKTLSSKMNAQGMGDLQKLVADMQAAGVKDGTRVATAETPSAPIIASVKTPQTSAALG